MSEETARTKIEPWLSPISDGSPAGDDARYEPLHEEIRNEAAKMDSPTTGMPNWEKLVSDAQKLTQETSKDLLIESYAAFAMYQTEGLLGLAAGLFLLSESMDRYWEAMQPPVRRVRARVNAIQWLTEKLDTTLPETPVGPGDHDAVEALEAGVKRLRAVVAEKFEDQAPALRPMADAVERLKMSLPPRPEGGAASDTEPPPPGDGAGAAAPAEPAPGPPEAADAAPAPGPAPTPEVASAEAAAAEPTPPAADAAAAEAAPVDLAAELAEKAKEWVEPIPGDSPVGIDAKYEIEVEELRNDVATLDSPTGGDLSWEKAVPRAGKVLQQTSKDLLIASYLAYGKWEVEGIEGLATGLEVITQICERYWEDCFPPARRIRGRANAIAWLLDKLEGPLPEAKLTAEHKHAVDLLEEAVKRFSNVVRDKFEDAAPPIRPLINNVQRLKMSLPAPAPKAPPPAPAKAAPAAPAQPAQPRPAAPATGGAPAAVSLDAGAAALADPSEVAKFSKDIAKSLVDAGKALRAAAPADPAGYHLLRLGMLANAKIPPAEGIVTKAPPPQEPVITDFELQLSNENWEALLNKAELTLASKPFWLDLHRYSALALTNLGGDYDAAKACVLAGTAYYLKRFPELLDLQFAGGMPFASDLTKEWLSSEVASGGGGGGGAAAGEAGEGAEVLSEARALAAGGKVDDALAVLEGLANSARSQRARFKARLAMAQSLSSGATAAAAEGIYDALSSEIEANGLERWEPELAIDVYRGHLACLKAMKKGNDPIVSQQAALVYRRLCRVDPVGAVKAAG